MISEWDPYSQFSILSDFETKYKEQLTSSKTVTCDGEKIDLSSKCRPTNDFTFWVAHFENSVVPLWVYPPVFAALPSTPLLSCVNIDLLLWRCFQLKSIVGSFHRRIQAAFFHLHLSFTHWSPPITGKSKVLIKICVSIYIYLKGDNVTFAKQQPLWLQDKITG